MATIDSIIELYTVFLGRTVTATETNYWLNSAAAISNLAPGATQADKENFAIKQISISFSTSTEYKSHGKSHHDFVKYVYKNAFNVEPDTATLQTYVSKLDSGEIKESDMALNVIGMAKLSPKGKLHLDHKTQYSKYFVNTYANVTIKIMGFALEKFNLITDDPKTLDDAKMSTDTLANDATAPVFSKATVDGKTVVLSYTDASPLATNIDKTAFLVHSNKTVVDISTAVVNAEAKTITLTLSTAVTKTDAVDVSYFAPPADKTTDNKAVQDAVGNDAALLNQVSVTNNTGTASTTTSTDSINPISGTSGVDTLTGTANADAITGAGSADVLTGNAGADKFIYTATSGSSLMTEVGSALGTNATTAPSLSNVEKITDFVSGTDKIQLAVAFANSVNGTNSTTYSATTSTGLATTDFVTVASTGLTADAGNARFYFNSTSNVLYFDASGDTAIDSTGAYTAGATDDFAVLQLTGTIASDDFAFA